jgi:hypothetical protein
VNLHEISGIVAGIVFAMSASWYVLDVARHKVVPSIATFLIFTIINISQLASLIVEQVWAVLPFAIVGTVASLSVCIFAIQRKKFYLELPDKIGFIGALLGCFLWFSTRDAALNLYVLNAVNMIAFLPLIIKSFKRPDLESLFPWQLNLIASFFLLLTINSAEAVVWIVPVRQFICSILLNLGLYFGIKRKAEP